MNMTDLAHNVCGIEPLPESLSIRMEDNRQKALRAQRVFGTVACQIRTAEDDEIARALCADADVALAAIDAADKDWQGLLAELKTMEGE